VTKYRVEILATVINVEDDRSFQLCSSSAQSALATIRCCRQRIGRIRFADERLPGAMNGARLSAPRLRKSGRSRAEASTNLTCDGSSSEALAGTRNDLDCVA
jgi:hypothetical protein